MFWQSQRHPVQEAPAPKKRQFLDGAPVPGKPATGFGELVRKSCNVHRHEAAAPKEAERDEGSRATY